MLKPGEFRDICWDDLEWRDVLSGVLKSSFEVCAEGLADALDGAFLLTFHGCRTEDAGEYHSDGLKVHDRETMAARLHGIVESNPSLAWMKDRLNAAISEIDNEIDVGRLYVVVDDTGLLEEAAHYLIYHSEWIVAVLGEAGRPVLRSRGVPTLLEIDLPLRMASRFARKELALVMLCEWTRCICNEPDWSAPIDFSFCLDEDIAAEFIVGHSHPRELPDPLERGIVHRTKRHHCKACERSQLERAARSHDAPQGR